MSQKQYALYDDRFLEPIAVTHIMGDPKISIIELIANSWDAGATEVTILWPEEDEQKFSIKDDGHGMTKAHFLKRFRTLAYNRIREQGSIAEIPPDHQDKIGSRPTFGRNGKGRLGGFAFGDSYTVVTSRDGQESTFKVAKDLRHTLTFQEIGDQKPNANHGTKIFIESAVKPHLSVEEARKEIGMRFLTDPNFKVKLNGVEISFADIPEDHIHEMNMI
ncbi:MAG TPA: ATP-binding protein, partial [Chitinophagaceae bacterium]|nr:ATP-binding protein [Chitinophagaceae bacterium]